MLTYLIWYNYMVVSTHAFPMASDDAVNGMECLLFVSFFFWLSSYHARVVVRGWVHPYGRAGFVDAFPR